MVEFTFVVACIGIEHSFPLYAPGDTNGALEHLVVNLATDMIWQIVVVY